MSPREYAAFPRRRGAGGGRDWGRSSPRSSARSSPSSASSRSRRRLVVRSAALALGGARDEAPAPRAGDRRARYAIDVSSGRWRSSSPTCASTRATAGPPALDERPRQRAAAHLRAPRRQARHRPGRDRRARGPPRPAGRRAREPADSSSRRARSKGPRPRSVLRLRRDRRVDRPRRRRRPPRRAATSTSTSRPTTTPERLAFEIAVAPAGRDLQPPAPAPRGEPAGDRRRRRRRALRARRARPLRAAPDPRAAPRAPRGRPTSTWRRTPRPAATSPADDKRKVELALSHLRVALPEGGHARSSPRRVDGHVRVRAPLGLAERAAQPPRDRRVDRRRRRRALRRGHDHPRGDGHLEAHDIAPRAVPLRAGDPDRARSSASNVVRAPTTHASRIADGVATFTDARSTRSRRGSRSRRQLDVADVSFTALMRDLGVPSTPTSAGTSTSCTCRSSRARSCRSTLDGDFTGQHRELRRRRPRHDDPAHERIFGFTEAALAAHVAVRPTPSSSRACARRCRKSAIDGGFVLDRLPQRPRASMRRKVDDRPRRHLAARRHPARGAGRGRGARLAASSTIRTSRRTSSIADFVLGDMPFGERDGRARLARRDGASTSRT